MSTNVTGFDPPLSPSRDGQAPTTFTDHSQLMHVQQSSSMFSQRQTPRTSLHQQCSCPSCPATSHRPRSRAIYAAQCQTRHCGQFGCSHRSRYRHPANPRRWFKRETWHPDNGPHYQTKPKSTPRATRRQAGTQNKPQVKAEAHTRGLAGRMNRG